MKIVNGIFSVLGRILGFLFTVFISAYAGMVLGWCWIGFDNEIGDPVRAAWNASSAMNYQLVEK